MKKVVYARITIASMVVSVMFLVMATIRHQSGFHLFSTIIVAVCTFFVVGSYVRQRKKCKTTTDNIVECHEARDDNAPS